MSEDAWFFIFMCISFAFGVAAQRVWNVVADAKHKMKITVDNSEAIRGFIEAMHIARRYGELLDEINVKSVECRRNMELIRAPKELH